MNEWMEWNWMDADHFPFIPAGFRVRLKRTIERFPLRPSNQSILWNSIDVKHQLVPSWCGPNSDLAGPSEADPFNYLAGSHYQQFVLQLKEIITERWVVVLMPLPEPSTNNNNSSSSNSSSNRRNSSNNSNNGGDSGGASCGAVSNFVGFDEIDAGYENLHLQLVIKHILVLSVV